MKQLEPCRCVYDCRCSVEAKSRRRELERQLLADRKLYGYSVLDASGRRVDPRNVKMEMEDL